MFKKLFNICLILVFLFATSQAIAGKDQVEFYPKANPADNLALTAIENYLSQINENLHFSKVVMLNKQVVAGLNYFMTVEFLNVDSEPVNYNVQIYVVPWEQFSEIKSFQRLNTEKKEFKQPQFMKDQMEQLPTKFLGKKVTGKKTQIKQNGRDGAAVEIDFEKEEQLVKTLILSEISSKINSSQDQISIVKATKQVVSGMLYGITFTNGKETFYTDAFVQLWNNKISLRNFTKLGDLESSSNDASKNIKRSAKPQTGNSEVIDFNNEDIQIVELITNNLKQHFNSNQDIEVIRATKKVVNGLMYGITFNYGQNSYYADVQVQVWNQNVTIHNLVELEQKQEQKQAKKSGNGQKQTINFDEEDKQITDLVKSYLMSQINTNQDQLQILQATKQVISGLMYGIYFTEGTYKYYADVIVKIWENSVEIQNFKKISEIKKKTGTKQSINFYEEDQMIVDLVKSQLLIKMESNDTEIKVLKASKQVVSGLIYGITFTDGNKKYYADVLVKLWEKSVEIQNFKTLEKKQNQPPKPPGSQETLDFYSEDKEIVDFIIENIKMKINSGNDAAIKVLKAKKQVVNGLKYTLKFTDGIKNYKTDVIVKLWEKSIEFLNFQVFEKKSQQPQKMNKQNSPMAGSYNDFDFSTEESNTQNIIFDILYRKMQVTNSNAKINVIAAKKQIVNGINYLLEFSYLDEIYEAKVYINFSGDEVKLVDFAKLD